MSCNKQLMKRLSELKNIIPSANSRLTINRYMVALFSILNIIDNNRFKKRKL